MDKGSLEIASRDDLPLLLGKESIAVELGVARGNFSETLLHHENIKRLFSIDAWADRGHNDLEYRFSEERLSKFGERSSILRMTFHDAVSHFDDGYFDFVYIDGYAHEGEDGGRTIWEWWPKVKSGGILAGHDYSDYWPLVVKEVDRFASENKLTLRFTREPIHVGTCTFPSWFVRKNEAT